MLRILTVLLASIGAGLAAQNGDAISFSKSHTINFYREVVSRDLAGLAIRSDGRIISGPTLTPLAGAPGADLWWDWEPLGPEEGLVGTGPDGSVLRVTVSDDGQTYATEVWAESDANHLFSIKHLARRRLVVAGSSPDATLYVWNDQGTELARVALPADSIFDLLADPAESTLLVATGNPGNLYRVNLETLIEADPSADLADRGVSLLGKVRDRNIRQLAWAPSGDVLAGSAPSGNLYQFPAKGGDPVILMDQESGEVTDIITTENSDVWVAVVAAEGNTRRRVIRTASVTPQQDDSDDAKKKESEDPAPSIMEAAPVEKFSGRSSLVKIPGGTGLPESLSSRNNLAIYQILPHEGIYLLPGGDDGELAGYDPAARRAISFAGSSSAQLTEITPTATSGSYYVMTNNPAGLSRLNFDSREQRTAQTKRINLQTPSTIGALRFNRLRGTSPEDVKVKMRANRGRDTREGWTPWIDALPRHGGWLAPGLTGQYVEISIAAKSDSMEPIELDRAELFYTPHNRRPVLQSFRLISPNFGLNFRPNNVRGSTLLTLGQVTGSSPISNNSGFEADRKALMASQVVPTPGA